MTDTRPGLRVALSLGESGHLPLPLLLAGVALVLLLLVNNGGNTSKDNTAKTLRKEWRRDRRKDRRRNKRRQRRQDKRNRRRAVMNSGGLGGGYEGYEGYDDPVGNALIRLLAMIGRFLAGREMRRRRASNATFWGFGSRPIRDSLKVQPLPLESASIGIPEARYLPAIPERPGAAVERWKDWTAGHPVSGMPGKAVRHGGAAAVWAGAAIVQALRGIVAIRSALRSWGTWPYAFRAAVRLAVLATLAGWWLDRGTTELAAGATVAAILGIAATGPAGLGVWHGPTWGDDRTLGPSLWVAIRKVLKLEDEEYLEYWMSIPADTRAEDAQVRLRLPLEFPGTEIEQAQIDHLVNTRLPGEWVSRWHLMGADHYAVWTHKPKPKPKPQCPDFVDFFDPEIQAAIRGCAKGEVVLGRDEMGQIRIEKLSGDTAHWGLSIGSGGGKSSFNMMVIAQLIAQGYHVVVIDVKRNSVKEFIGVPGVHIYNDPGQIRDMRRAIDWVVEEMLARSAAIELQPDIEFPGLVLFIEEATEFAVLSKEWWDENRQTTNTKDSAADPAADPIWGRVGTGARLGRAMWANIILITQDLRDSTFGGKGLRNAFPLKFMGKYTSQQWKNVIDTTPVPEAQPGQGRVLAVEGAIQKGWIQSCYGDPNELAAWAREERKRTEFDPTAGLFGKPPARSPKQLPQLLAEAASRDELPEGLKAALRRGSEGSAAGGAVTPGSRDAARDALPTGSRDGHWQVADAAARGPLTGVERLKLAARQHAAQQAADGATTPRDHGADTATQPAAGNHAPAHDTVKSEALFTLAEISQRLEMRGIEISDARMRKAKSRDKQDGKNQFPAGTEVERKNGTKATKYTESEILEYFQNRGSSE